MSTLQIPSSSKEFLPVAVISDADPTGTGVKIAVTEDEDTEPAPDDFETATWVTGQITALVNGKWQKAWVARIMVSGEGFGGTIELAEGDWVAWAQFSDGQQLIVRSAGKFKVT